MSKLAQNKLWFGTIPSGWETDKIVSLFDFPNEKVNDVDYEPLSVTYSGVKKQIENAAKTDNGSNRKRVKAGDIVINGRSDRKGAVGVSEYDGSVSVVYHVLRSRKEKIDVRYYHHLFRSTPFSEEFYKWGKGIVDDLWTTRTGEMKRIMVPVPTLEIQKKIARYLDEKTKTIDSLIEKKEKLIELLQYKRAAIIKRAVTKGLDSKVSLVDSHTSWLGKVPKDWRLSKLRFLAKFNPRRKSPLSPNLMASFLPMEAISETGALDLSEERSLSQLGGGFTYFEEGDIIRAKIVPCFQNGKGAVARGLTNGVGLGTTELHVLRPNPDMDADFLYYILVSDFFTKLGEINMRGVAGQQRVPELFIKDFVVAVPPLKVQKQIAEHLKRKNAQIDIALKKVTDSIAQLQAYRSSVIYATVTGKIKV